MTAAPERGQADGFLGPLGDGALGHGVSLHGWVLLRPYAKWKLGYPERRRLHAYDAFQYQNEEECGVNESHVDCSDAFNISQVFDNRDDVLQWARSVVHANGFVAIIIRFDTNTNSRGRTLFVLIGCERSGKYRCRKKKFVRRDTRTRKCGCPFKLHGKPVVGGQG
ncbi:hypothetical protein GmHk_07G020408 [Glycine max]|nr:hypothetical protein GmHk_07G020408 [Glycine max]